MTNNSEVTRERHIDKPRLFHVSEDPNIKIFEPRPPPNAEAGVVGDAVWAIDEIHLCNYLLPRDCPRVTFAGATCRVVAVEQKWVPTIEACKLYLYEFPKESFELLDAGAGYYISRKTVAPKSVTKLDNLLTELERRNVEVRVLENLWPLRDEIAASSFEFSIIRFRNAQPRQN